MVAPTGRIGLQCLAYRDVRSRPEHFQRVIFPTGRHPIRTRAACFSNCVPYSNSVRFTQLPLISMWVWVPLKPAPFKPYPACPIDISILHFRSGVCPWGATALKSGASVSYAPLQSGERCSTLFGWGHPDRALRGSTAAPAIAPGAKFRRATITALDSFSALGGIFTAHSAYSA